MFDHRAANPPASRHVGGVHGLQLGVAVIEPFQRCDAEQLAVATEAERRSRRGRGEHLRPVQERPQPRRAQGWSRDQDVVRVGAPLDARRRGRAPAENAAAGPYGAHPPL
jgi:hypothetical protein